ncbi:hypothetical protein [Bacillus sp. AFS055030]|uniref:VOC family protein n=1 Tax=Bacillus sp. AFS055030 TaxID=2033507 RepID=UPI0011558282|nr:hypothetical protein [Bacillus sp. AFS055030]
MQPGQEFAYVNNYLKHMDGILEYEFRLEEYFNLKVIGLQSVLGNVSAVVIDDKSLSELPDFIQYTNSMFVVDSIEAVYEKAKQLGIPILQPRTENIMGAQGRLLLAPGYIIELAEATNESLFYPDARSLGYVEN